MDSLGFKVFKRVARPGPGLRPSISQGLEFSAEHTDQKLLSSHRLEARHVVRRC